MSERILIVDDDEQVCEMVSIALEAEGFLVDKAYDGQKGVNIIFGNQYAVIVLDIMLPEIDGWEICRRIRSSHLKGIPVIMLTAREEEVDRVLGLELGADDYVTKPFSPRELVARVRALIRRSDNYNLNREKISRGSLTIDPHSHTAQVGEQELQLTPIELDLLNLLIQNEGKSFTRQELLKEVWGYDEPAGRTRTVDEHIKRLRAKIYRCDEGLRCIHTVWGIGYKFEVKDNG